MSTITYARVREVLRYDKHAGVFFWRETLSARAVAGSLAGSFSNGYWWIRIDGELFGAHRIAFLFMEGRWPDGDIDHRNGIRIDNCYRNLRDVPKHVNQQNRRRAQANNKTGTLGVCWATRERKYLAQIKVEGRSKFIGYFKTIEGAQAAYLAEKRALHAGCTI